MPDIPSIGEAVPWFRAAILGRNRNYAFDSAGGRYVLLLFAGSTAFEPCARAVRLVERYRELFDDRRAVFFGVTSDPRDEREQRIAQMLPGIRWFLDDDRTISRRFGASGEGNRYRPFWLLLDPMLRTLAQAPLDRGETIMRQLQELVGQPREEGHAPVLIVPRVFDGAMCRRLIDLYEEDGGRPSGFMREVDGVTVGVHDHRVKRRSDFSLDDHPDLRAQIREILQRNLVPLIQRAFQFRTSRIERYLVACYDGDGDGGYFRTHRDNTTAGTAHRRFACSINLNAEEYEGGDLRFPEFGTRRYRPPTGGAVVFSCSLLHEAMPVTRGRRYAYLPFLYDEDAARQREAMAMSDKVAPELATYRA